MSAEDEIRARVDGALTAYDVEAIEITERYNALLRAGMEASMVVRLITDLYMARCGYESFPAGDGDEDDPTP